MYLVFQFRLSFQHESKLLNNVLVFISFMGISDEKRLAQCMINCSCPKLEMSSNLARTALQSQ